MSTLASSFPYTVDDEPTEEWNVGQLLQWWLLRAHGETDAKYDEVVQELTKQVEQGKSEIWDCHKQVVETLKTGGISRPPVQEVIENVDPQQQHQELPQHYKLRKELSSKSHQQQLGTSAKPSSGRAATPGTIFVEVLEGEYEGNTYDLQPRAKAPCWIGRSQGKKFRDRGISLPKDLEVSTTHGKFELLRGNKLCFTDTNSTNGSKAGDEILEPDAPFELQNGTEILVGQTLMRITLL